MHLLKRVIDQIKRFQVTGDFYAYDYISPFDGIFYRKKRCNLGMPNMYVVIFIYTDSFPLELIARV